MSSLYQNSDKTEDDNNQERREWLESLEAVLSNKGPEQARSLVESLVEKLRSVGIKTPISLNTDYVNTIPVHLQSVHPGNLKIESRINAYIRWNAMAMVVKANCHNPEDGGSLGGHISSFASLATMIACGYNHFWKSDSTDKCGDLVYFQGHSSPGIYSRAYLEGFLSEKHLDNFRQEICGNGLPSYPHPRLMPDFWQFPTVSVGLSPIMAIYQARFLKYLHARGILDTSDRKVWVFCGDGEMDEPESLGAISLASRENLDNLIFVVNCNLQRLDGPVRGNGKIIQELERIFIGAGWNVIKLVWGGYWDSLLDNDKDGILRKVMQETVDGEYQAYKANDGKFVRDNFFSKHPRLLESVSHMSDSEIWRLNRGGHDPNKVYAAFDAANKHTGQPSIILAKTIKGYGVGHFSQSKNATHQHKKLDLDSIREFRDRFGIPVPDDKLADLPYFKPSEDSPEMKYMRDRRQELGGYMPRRRQESDNVPKVPSLENFRSVLDPTSNGREISTTQAFVRILNSILRNKDIGPRVVPILADESRTFGMEGLFRQLGIYTPGGQQYEPVDKDQVMYYRETSDGQLLQEGINEAGAMSSWIAAATSYSTNNYTMIPFFIYYSMFGFQRVCDLAWAAADMKARGFLLGGTSGRTTLNGEGLQHEDGHSHIIASTIPSCVSYDPAFAHELAVIIQSGLKRMVEDQEDVYYYITLMNENYSQPGLIDGDEDGILKGMYKFRSLGSYKNRVQLLGSGAILRESIVAQDLLEEDWSISSDVWSVTSFTELRRNGLDIERYNLLQKSLDSYKVPYFTEKLLDSSGPIIASTDYMKSFADQVRPFIPKGRDYYVLGTDGFGRSDFRFKLRDYFEVDRYYIVLSALKALAYNGVIGSDIPYKAIVKYGINPDKINPHRV
ncbi:pyruvate dehydrogenase E1 component [Candidatus Kinetoplastibacterium blastocrithidii TCC012E]|uniref:Pyruvate dehydrogenase E1 component n=1 Tax=Candidatus Kinetoplastidibacterium blastocrithidiae TCC012E TaxID=1208922 RepID=M1LW06_9PROT|nr:pyruvate dehydrogenase (acetyl-transferring), homodimeric type [Candidatus Kinetoplastibacterium blastocrithidii]AFZ83611.1 pyruvate dehydrogenase subunit E1 [Candidatus Kinetoplastibacterium blastocrithidii (ex Strigomonas culicis)]AGF49732.1 pyruvate dehydrogenase E1 component [Candidatus Kinetoplastibacterium blastocrithidii TCC012E]